MPKRTRNKNGRNGKKKARPNFLTQRFISKNPMGMLPQELMGKFTTSAVVEFSGATSNAEALTINSLNDPLGSVSTRQPDYFDTLKTMYSRYIVHAAKVRLDIMNNSGSATVQFETSMTPRSSGDSTAPTDIDDAISGYGEWAEYAMVSQAGGAAAPITMEKYYKIKDIEGVSDIDITEYQAGVSENPTRQVRCDVLTANLDQSSPATLAYTIRYTVTQYAKMFDLKPTADT